jgi:CBS domain-containing protein
MKVSDVMTRRVISVSPETSVFVAIRLMLKHHVSGLPVIDNHAKLVGLLSEGDLLRRGEIETERKRSVWLDALFGPADGAADYVHSHGLTVKEVMTPDPITVAENTTLDEVVRLMENRNVKRLPVLRDERVIGIVSRANLMRALLSIHRTTPQSSDNDAAIREHVLAEVRRHDWSSGAAVDVVVQSGNGRPVGHRRRLGSARSAQSPCGERARRSQGRGSSDLERPVHRGSTYHCRLNSLRMGQ